MVTAVRELCSGAFSLPNAEYSASPRAGTSLSCMPDTSLAPARGR